MELQVHSRTADRQQTSMFSRAQALKPRILDSAPALRLSPPLNFSAFQCPPLSNEDDRSARPPPPIAWFAEFKESGQCETHASGRHVVRALSGMVLLVFALPHLLSLGPQLLNTLTCVYTKPFLSSS